MVAIEHTESGERETELRGIIMGRAQDRDRGESMGSLDFAKHLIKLIHLDGFRVLQLSPGLETRLRVHGG